jgi:hypothetical protein
MGVEDSKPLKPFKSSAQNLELGKLNKKVIRNIII